MLLGALSLLMFPAAQHLRSFRDGERASAVLHRSGSCLIGNCRIAFEVDGRTVMSDLPVGSGGGKNSTGDRMFVRYRAEDPQSAVREADTDGGGAAVLAVVSSGAALLFLMLSIAGVVYTRRQRRQRI
ncbi:hypothetical protein ACIQ9E_07570 [Streptomyces sp. NPDC094448]|uniref:hypothetical protein n=1 Tax=Streptomyces sp. NPDC094448 TaxID=3366063 RepID=UPI00382B7D01